ncbi:sensor histidine kinase [Flavicella sediminum]|uniref:sensor histidine kinase n=1 Tax=Flavicella sediminum TaxID=2585141 RepID=UPI001AA07A17|nr:7TM diverse intracellular signaling domain-containing protein [Flavicella sediminum]
MNFFLILFCAVALTAQEQKFTIVLDGKLTQTISKQEVFSEKQISTTIESLLSNTDLFEEETNPFVNRGAFYKNHWLKFSIINKSENSKFVLEFNQTYIDSLQVFLVKNQRIVKTYPKQGLHFKTANSDNYLSNKYAYIFPFELAPNEKIQFYIQAMINDGSFRVMNKIWTEQAYKTRVSDIKFRSSYLLVFSGFVSLILVLSLTMFAFSRDRLYLYYIGFVIVIFTNLLCLRHMISPVFIENYFLFGNNFVEMLSFLQLFFMLMYANKFLSLKKNHPRFYWTLHFLALTIMTLFIAGLYLRHAAFWFYYFSFYISKILVVLVTFTIYYVAISLVRKKNKMAYYFVIAYFPLLIFIVHYIFTALGLTTSYNPLQLEFVLFFEIVVLAVALAHKYYLLIVQNYKFQKEIISTKEKSMAAILQAQEEERGRIARDLHDGVVQQIGSVLLRARNLLTDLKLIHKKESQELLQNLESSNQDLRTISHQMMPRALKELGVVHAITDLLNSSLGLANIEFKFENFNIESRMDPTHEIVLYRVLQELINNIIKHSEASFVNVQLFISGQYIMLLVEDNGKGFDIDKQNKGVGLRNMKSRVDVVNGTFDFESVVKKGTLVRVKIPLV